MSESTRIALVLGATGGIGAETALALSRRAPGVQPDQLSADEVHRLLDWVPAIR